ncbi:23S rRNA (cytidine-2'-O)-methyltransferase TlyA [Campylobacter sputorum]|uniref:23S rRNA (cytidine-2'-O)-methyltransferase TlyA n=1 Tax=Campylobacter sputorum TaxID=206 RepID=UPI001E4D0168|nr:TlyA family RNA methyltransferase [Campylobacter sputorum]
MRFDQFVANKLNISRNKALNLIKEDKVFLDGKLSNSPSVNVISGEITLNEQIFVSRGALKLKPFLKELNLNLNSMNALDVGSSTGGFVEILLQNGVKSVTALDVGTMQLDKNLRNDSRVVVMENTDIRDFKSEVKFDITTCDVSFISLKNIMQNLKNLTEGIIITLFKPQFEVGIFAKRNKKGVVTDQKAIIFARRDFELFCINLGLEIILTKECNISGKNGNKEYFYAFRRI